VILEIYFRLQIGQMYGVAWGGRLLIVRIKNWIDDSREVDLADIYDKSGREKNLCSQVLIRVSREGVAD
jgi:hypothetical protein